MADSIEEIKKAQKSYIYVFVALLICTVATVAVATIPALDIGEHGFDTADMVLGLIIATFKASLVGAIFMHLNHEKKAIYWLFGSGLFFCFWLMVLTGWAYADPIKFDGFYDGISNWVK